MNKWLIHLLLNLFNLSSSYQKDKQCNDNTDCKQVAPFMYCKKDDGYEKPGTCQCVTGRAYNPNQQKCECTNEADESMKEGIFLGGCVDRVKNKKWQALPCVNGGRTVYFIMTGTDSKGAFCECKDDYYGESCEKRDEIIMPETDRQKPPPNDDGMYIIIAAVASVVAFIAGGVAVWQYLRLKKLSDPQNDNTEASGSVTTPMIAMR